MMKLSPKIATLCFVVAMQVPIAAHAQLARAPADSADDGPVVHLMLGGGPFIEPRFPGSSDFSLGFFPQIEIWSDDERFPAEPPDETLSIELVGVEGAGQAGLTVNGSARRHSDDLDYALAPIGFGVEFGGYASTYITPNLRLRGEVRQGIGGHKALTGDLQADWVVRTADDRLVATIGPRVRWGSDKYNRAYFGVTPAEATATGLSAYAPHSGIYAVGAMAGAQYRVSARWGLFGFAGYGRLIGQAARSPIVRQGGSRDQLTTGMALTYTFDIRR